MWLPGACLLAKSRRKRRCSALCRLRFHSDLHAYLLRQRGHGTDILLTSHLLGSLTEPCDECTVLDDGTVRRRYQAAEFNEVQADLLAEFYQDKLAQVHRLLPLE